MNLFRSSSRSSTFSLSSFSAGYVLFYLERKSLKTHQAKVKKKGYWRREERGAPAEDNRKYQCYMILSSLRRHFRGKHTQ